MVGLIAAAVLAWQAVVWFGDRQDEDRRDEAIAVARAQVLDLTTLDSETIDAKLDAMGKRLSGAFKRQFEGFAQTFSDVVNDDKIRATGELKSVAVDQYDGEAASILVATSAEVTHGDAKRATTKDYRMKVDLEHKDAGWLITGMEFVG
ncbi:hypothetical protein [Nocardioides sp. WS12]|uniref:hypothetical protein n=1 Tax=Nocardioides sp. WS12 TaxID=2486272 RepID=UPI0015FB3288|nr:hypothetical protein [Nocardioides sp. WS12]